MTNEKDAKTPVNDTEKNCRHRKIIFTKICNAFQNLVNVKAQESMLEEAYVALVLACNALDKSHNKYTGLVEEAMIKAEEDYLEESFNLYSEAQVTW